MNRYLMNRDPTEVDYAVKILKRAKLLLSEHGWVRRQNGDGSQGYCLVGAVQSAYLQIKAEASKSSLSETDRKFLAFDMFGAQAWALRHLENTLEATGKERWLNVWNEQRTSVKPVLGLLDQATSTLEETVV